MRCSASVPHAWNPAAWWADRNAASSGWSSVRASRWLSPAPWCRTCGCRQTPPGSLSRLLALQEKETGKRATSSVNNSRKCGCPWVTRVWRRAAFTHLCWEATGPSCTDTRRGRPADEQTHWKSSASARTGQPCRVASSAPWRKGKHSGTASKTQPNLPQPLKGCCARHETTPFIVIKNTTDSAVNREQHRIKTELQVLKRGNLNACRHANSWLHSEDRLQTESVSHETLINTDSWQSLEPGPSAVNNQTGCWLMEGNIHINAQLREERLTLDHYTYSFMTRSGAKQSMFPLHCW